MREVAVADIKVPMLLESAYECPKEAFAPATKPSAVISRKIEKSEAFLPKPTVVKVRLLPKKAHSFNTRLKRLLGK